MLHDYGEGVRGVAGVALATPFFRFYFIKLSKKNSQNYIKNIVKLIIIINI